MRLLIQLLTGLENMQYVMAFPNTTSVESLMDSSPRNVIDPQLKELGITIRNSRVLESIGLFFYLCKIF